MNSNDRTNYNLLISGYNEYEFICGIHRTLEGHGSIHDYDTYCTIVNVLPSMRDLCYVFCEQSAKGFHFLPSHATIYGVCVHCALFEKTKIEKQAPSSYTKTTLKECAIIITRNGQETNGVYFGRYGAFSVYHFSDLRVVVVYRHCPSDLSMRV